MWQKREDNLGVFCHRQEGTLGHLFFTCPHVKTMWEEFCFTYREFITGELSFENIINSQLDTTGHIVNFLTIVLKQYIHITRCQQELPGYFNFKENI